MMPETKFTLFPALSVDPRVGISRSASKTDDLFFFLPFTGKIKVLKRIFTITNTGCYREVAVVER